MIDLLVAGGGPIGLATAIEARLAGMEVIVVEPRASLIDKACGEGLMPAAGHLLNSLGVAPSGIDFFGIRYLAGDRSIAARFTEGRGMGVRRTELYEALHQRAFELGVQWRQDLVGIAVLGERPLDLASYEKEWFKITRSYRMLTGTLLWAASHPPLRRLILPSACAMPWAFQKIVDSLAA